MAVVGKGKKGQDVVLLNPSEKGTKYCLELTSKKHFYNNLTPKKDENGRDKLLSPEAKAYRKGYIQAQKDSAKVYNYNQTGQKKKDSSFKTSSSISTRISNKLNEMISAKNRESHKSRKKRR